MPVTHKHGNEDFHLQKKFLRGCLENLVFYAIISTHKGRVLIIIAVSEFLILTMEKNL
jgi:hypothetical protein